MNDDYEDYHLGDYQESSTHNQNTEKPGHQRDSATDSHVDSTDDKAFNLPAPHEYDRNEGNALDYFTDEYAEANSLEEAIEMRGEKAFLKNVEPEDFLDKDSSDLEKIGIAELFVQSTWRMNVVDDRDKEEEEEEEEDDDDDNEDADTGRDVELEQRAASVKEGDWLEIRPCPKQMNPCGYQFYTSDGQVSPFEPYHDYDDQFFLKSLDNLYSGENLVCHVQGTLCYGENGIEPDPQFCWRAYTCKVMVYRVQGEEE